MHVSLIKKYGAIPGKDPSGSWELKIKIDMLQTECCYLHHLQTINTHVSPFYYAKYLYTSLPLHCFPDPLDGNSKVLCHDPPIRLLDGE